jgi:hypothetical protein
MLSRCSRIFFLKILVPMFVVAAVTPGAGALGTPVHAAPTVVLGGLGKGMVPLDGPWQFHLGDDAAWAAPGLDDSGWEQLTGDKPWGAQGHPSYEGFAWYRLHIAVTPAPGASPDVALMLEGVDDAYELYWNGRLVARNGELPPHPVWYPFEPPQTFGLGPVRTGVLAVRVWKAPLGSNDTSELGGFEASPAIGSPDGIAAAKAFIDFRWLRGQQIEFALIALNTLVALFSLVAWLRDRRQWLLFWMAGYTLTPLIGQLLTGMRLPLSAAVAIGLLQPAALAAPASG